MKIGIIADIHSNYTALIAALDKLAAHNVRDIISLGDNIGYGPDPEQVIDTLLKYKVRSVLGNHEYALQSDRYLYKLNPGPRKSLLLNRDLLSEENLAHCVNMPQVLLRHGARFVHGCPPKSPSAYLYRPSDLKLERLYAGFDEQICFYGHTHSPAFFEGLIRYHGETLYGHPFSLATDKRYLINPGSVGQPRDQLNNRAKFLIWDHEESSITFHAVEYDVKTTVERLRSLGFPDFNAERLLL